MSGADLVITFLGSGSAIPPLNRQQSSIALRHTFGLTIFDCGEGTQYSLRRNHISTKNEIVICISHLHSDHFLGLPGLLASFELLERKEDIIIIGPPRTSTLVQNLLVANFVKTTYKILIVELEPSQQFKGNGYKIIAIKALHEANALSYLWVENTRPGKIDIDAIKSLGIPDGPLIGRLQRGEAIKYNDKTITSDMVQGPPRPGRSICYSGDTAFNPKLPGILQQGCDLLIHEATYPTELVALAEERNHSTVKQAVELAKQAKVKRLILTHISPRIENFDDELNTAKLIFQNVEFAYDGLSIKLPYSKN